MAGGGGITTGRSAVAVECGGNQPRYNGANGMSDMAGGAGSRQGGVLQRSSAVGAAEIQIRSQTFGNQKSKSYTK